MSISPKTLFIRLWIVFLIYCFGMVMVSEVSRAASYRIGDKYGGGIIFYLDVTGQHGLIAAPEDIVIRYTDLWNKSPWAGVYRWSTGQEETVNKSDYAMQILSDTRPELGQGRANTAKILAKYPAATYPRSAAAMVRAYRGGGFSDWFLPSKDELNQLYINRALCGSFAGDYYWSSSEMTSDTAWYQYFSDGYQGGGTKSYYSRVRAVRAF